MTWRIVTRALYELGKPATVAEVEMQARGMDGASDSLKAAAHHGMVKAPGRSGAPLHRQWALTELGIAWCEHRAREVRGPLPEEIDRWERAARSARREAGPRPKGPRGRGMWFPATWLAALPRGVRIEPGPLQLAALETA